MLEGVTNNSSFELRKGHFILVAGSEVERFNTFIEWGEARELSAPTIVLAASGVMGAPRLAKDAYASLFGSMVMGTDAHSIVDKTREKVVRGPAHHFHAALVQANLRRPPRL